MSALFGTPHYEVVHRYGYHESVVARCATRQEADIVKRSYAAMDRSQRYLVRFVEL